MALGHRWPWDQVGGARVGRGTVALRYLGCLPTITSSISGVKDAQRSRRQSIWAVYTSLRHTAKYTGFGCILQVYSRLSSSRLACHAIQRIQRIQRIQPYSHTRHTSYSAIQPPSGLLVPACQPWSTEADHCCSLLVSAPSPPAPVIDQIASPLEAQTEAQKEQKLFRRRARGCHCIRGRPQPALMELACNVGNRQVAMRHIGSHELVKLAGARLQHG